MRNDVTDSDRGWKMLGQLFGKIEESNPSVAVGVQGSEAELLEADHGELTNVELAVIHEFGSDDGEHPPARPFIGSTIDDNLSEIQETLDKIAKGVFENETPTGSLMLLGEEIITKIKEKVSSGIDPELAEITLANPNRPKAGTVPLWASGQLVNSISAVIVNADDIERE